VLDEARESRVDIAFAPGMQDQGLNVECARCSLHVSNLEFRSGISGVDEKADNSDARDQLVQQFQPFCPEGIGKKSYSYEIATGTVEIGNETEIDRVSAHCENDWNGCGCSFGSYCRRRAERNDRGYGIRYQIGGHCRQPVEARIGRAIFDCEIAPLENSHHP
jgi:hypothetical protein